ncbi:TonB-dependent receptor plug domain-containing protein [Brevundimonas sp.]|uniref:TonB-dependent receptor plug domain-containing protein n=1 Tax=Brevundimonas sp. TaxID=1871086 RepID=UPI0035AF28CF
MSATLITALAVLAGAPTDDTTALPEIVVTATRVDGLVAETPGARVITEERIQQRGAVFAADILADLPGLSVVRTGAFGGVAQVRMRGAGVGKTLVLIDGVPVNDPADVSGAYDFAGLDLGGVERIEVLSGPQSSLWGSDAIGGVIAFTTRETEGIEALAEAGSFDTVRGRIGVGVAKEAYAVSGWVSRFDTDGISAADEADGNTEDDGFTNTSAGLRGRVELSPRAGLDAAVRWSESDADIDGFPAPSFALADTEDSQSSEQWSGYGRLRLSALGLDHQLSWSASEIDREIRSDFPSVFSGERRVWRWQADGQAGPAAFAFGAEREDSEASLSSGLSDELGTTSVFATARGDLTPRLNLSGALRFDDTDDFGSETTGRVSAAYDLGRGLILSGAYGTGFKAPSISQAVCDFCFSAEPFPVLRPERADGVEIALGWQAADGRASMRATLYRLEVEDQITYVTDLTTFDSVYVNIDQTRTDGIELEGQTILGRGFDLTLAYAWTDAVDESDGSRLLRVPEHSGSATLGWTADRLSAALTVRAESDQDDAGGVRDGFVTANLNGGWRVTDKVELTARIENLADEHYQQVLGYGEPGRSAYVGVRLRY